MAVEVAVAAVEAIASGKYPLDQRAVLWDGAGVVDLNDRVNQLDGWTLMGAWAIDDAGRILVNADREWQRRLVLLTPNRAQ